LADDPGLRETRTGLRRGTATVLEAITPPTPASVFKPGGRHFPAGVRKSHRTQAPPPTLFFPDAPASVFKPGGRHFPAGVRKPPDPVSTTNSLLSRCASIGLQARRATLPCRCA
jgi:hypothetical protein